MYGHTAYVHLDDYINKIGYPTEVPEYSIKKHELFEQNILQPFSIPDRNNVVLTRCTIAKMIDMHYDVIPFKIINNNDITEIFQYLSEYIRQLEQCLDIQEAADYHPKAIKFRDTLKRSLSILAHTDPVAKKLMNTVSISDMFKPLIKE